MTERTSECWRSIVGYEGHYEVSDHGRIRSLGHFYYGTKQPPRWASPKILIQYLGNRGYLTVHLNSDGHKHTLTVHKLVCEAFHGAKPAKCEVRHLNDVKTDNRASNLAWGTRTQNLHDAVENGVHPMSRKTHCKRGHAFSAANTQISADGKRRRCRACKRMTNARLCKERRQRRRGEAA